MSSFNTVPLSVFVFALSHPHPFWYGAMVALYFSSPLTHYVCSLSLSVFLSVALDITHTQVCEHALTCIYISGHSHNWTYALWNARTQMHTHTHFSFIAPLSPTPKSLLSEKPPPLFTSFCLHSSKKWRSSLTSALTPRKVLRFFEQKQNLPNHFFRTQDWKTRLLQTNEKLDQVVFAALSCFQVAHFERAPNVLSSVRANVDVHSRL